MSTCTCGVCVCVFVYVVYVCTEDSRHPVWAELVLFLHHMGPRAYTCVAKLGDKCLYPRSPLPSPLGFFMKFYFFPARPQLWARILPPILLLVLLADFCLQRKAGLWNWHQPLQFFPEGPVLFLQWAHPPTLKLCGTWASVRQIRGILRAELIAILLCYYYYDYFNLQRITKPH